MCQVRSVSGRAPPGRPGYRMAASARSRRGRIGYAPAIVWSAQQRQRGAVVEPDASGALLGGQRESVTGDHREPAPFQQRHGGILTQAGFVQIQPGQVAGLTGMCPHIGCAPHPVGQFGAGAVQVGAQGCHPAAVVGPDGDAGGHPGHRGTQPLVTGHRGDDLRGLRLGLEQGALQAGHVPAFRDAGDGHRVGRGRRPARRIRGEGGVGGHQRGVHLVGDDTGAVCLDDLGDPIQFLGGEHPAGGGVRVAQQYHAGTGAQRVVEPLQVQCPAVRAVQQRPRHHHAVQLLEQQEERRVRRGEHHHAVAGYGEHPKCRLQPGHHVGDRAGQCGIG